MAFTKNIMTQNKQYNYCLDFMKGIACLFVVWMHCEFPGRTGTMVQAISRFCVPFFFMVSGYFSGTLLSTDGERFRDLIIKKKVKHIAKITLWASLFYLAWAVLRHFVWNDKSLVVTKSQAVIWLFFNQPVVIGDHLWFLFALLYDYVLVSVFDHTKIHQKQFAIGLVSMILLFVLGQGFHLLDIRVPVPGFVRGDIGADTPQVAHIPNFVYRNWLIEGLAFFLLGRWIKENKDKVKLSNTVLLVIVGVSTLLCLVERKIMGRDFGVNICTLPQVAALFFYAVKNPERHAGLLQRIGRDCSMLVYILHIFVWELLAKIYRAIGVDSNILAQFILPILVVIVSIVLALVFNWIVSKFKKEPQIVKS